MIRSLYRDKDGQRFADLTPTQLTAAVQDKQGSLWLDFQAEPPERCEPVMRQTFGFHPLAIDDALRESHVPKLDDWEDYLYIVLQAEVFDRTEGDVGHLDSVELDVFLGKNYMVTHHDVPVAALDQVWINCQRDPRHLTKGADHLLYLLSDELVNSYMLAVDEMDEAIDDVEAEVFDRPGSEALRSLFTLKRSLLRLRRNLAPLREVFNKLARDEYAVIDSQDRIYFRDVYDHLVRLYDINESMRDLVAGALDTYLSVINNRMNEVMKTLTLITTLFMPISFVVGFFGMNFFQPVLPPGSWTGFPSLILALLVIVAAPVCMFLWMRRRRWM
jgi:magnesium transporter